MKKVPKTYPFAKIEPKIYRQWEKSGYFAPSQDATKKPFVIIMPPPNANGSLHTGHAVFVTLEDLLTRYHRMKGEPTLWLPGADHAGIQTQVVYEKELKKQGKTRFDLGRKKFYQAVYRFTMKNKKVMENQLRRLGASCDWSRERFTLEPEISRAVIYTFKKMYQDGLIYKGKRIINWCARCSTALSDIEVVYEKKDSQLTYLKYPLATGQGYITVATTRPETMLGDTAIAVHPQDKRYQKLIGQLVIHPFQKRKLPIIADEAVDMDFGTGALKITPAHDPLDFEIAQRHHLEAIEIIDQNRRMTKLAGPLFAGLKTNEAREKVVSELKKLHLIEKQIPYRHAVGVCERCKTIIEPLISEQWFVKIKPLAQKALSAVKRGQIKFYPKRFEKIYFNWLANIKDWCISRQIWWGHRIPVYYCQNCDHIMVEVEKPKKCSRCQSSKIKQDPDTLDTWFSSAQWPFTALGWNQEVDQGGRSQNGDFERFYPTSVMETGWDILFFWVARMIMVGLYATKKPPFKAVVFHGLVRDKDRVKMSKSKGNVIDPLGVVELYGADALRLALVFGTGIGNDIVISEEKIQGFRNFCNKIWNASRFILMNSPSKPKNLEAKKLKLTKEDRWILKELKETTKKVSSALEHYRFHQAAETLYNFFWHKFCDQTIEQAKPRIYGSDEEDKKAAQWVLYKVLEDSLKLLHPFVPFVTEAIWQKMGQKTLLMVEKWPNEK